VQKQIITVLKKGGLVIFPSDTVYGLLADATNEQAVKKLIQFKNRPWGKPISVFVDSFLMLEKLVDVNNSQLSLLKNLLPGPFTVILKSKGQVVSLLESEKKTLGIRLPSYPFITDLVKSFGKPITATSANLAGRPPHYSVTSLFNSLPKQKRDLIDLTVDVGDLPHNKTSTIVDLTEPEIKMLRKGDLVFDQKNSFISQSPEQTKKIAQYIFQKNFSSEKPLVFILQGELGTGKTVFAKGLGEQLGLEKIISPTFVIYYEYPIKSGKFFHFDLYQIADKEELENFKIEKMLVPGNILCFEWGEKSSTIIDLLKKKAKVVYVEMEYINEKERRIKYL